ncbi:MAG: GspH/FimT family pseudopilin [Selenomonadaceae bacterium]|nr:GspH/FimT family pseudopilin [Selenomonadaceae bacterium]
MQKGFATLEIIFAVMIFALLAGAALPNATRVLEISSLDYETKRLYSELRFAQALSRDSKVETAPMGGKFEFESKPGVTVMINSLNSSIRPDNWKIFRDKDFDDKILREQHYLRNGEKFSFKGNLQKISFDSAGKPKGMNDAAADGTLTLTTRSGRDKSIIVFNSVGRILVGRDHD